MSDYRIVCISENPDYMESTIDYIKSRWPLDNRIYEDCIANSINTPGGLPRWYVLVEDGEFIGSFGLITNDFISRQDLWPWFAALYIEEKARGRKLGAVLLEHGRKEAGMLGYDRLYLCTDHVGYYEKYGWERIGSGFHPWGDESSIYAMDTIKAYLQSNE